MNYLQGSQQNWWLHKRLHLLLEFKINKVMSLPLNRIAGLLDFKRRPYFSAKDMENICSFLTYKHQSTSVLNKNISQNKSTQVDPESIVENNLQ